MPKSRFNYEKKTDINSVVEFKNYAQDNESIEV